MKWVYTTFSEIDDGHIKPHMCHPFYHKIRMAYIFETYKAIPIKTERTIDLQVDFGGMLCTEDPYVEIPLVGERVISCWHHQTWYTIRVLEKAKPLKHGRRTFFKFARWPGVICIISKADRDKAIRYLKRIADREMEDDHSIKMREHLIQANARGDEVKEKKVRKMFDRLSAGQSPNN